VEDFEQKLQSFLDGCQQIICSYHKKHFPNISCSTLSTEVGTRYVRIVQNTPGSRSAWAFVDKTNGDVLKAASWKAPAKHARGNLFDESNGLKYIGPYGPAYLR